MCAYSDPNINSAFQNSNLDTFEVVKIFFFQLHYLEISVDMFCIFSCLFVMISPFFSGNWKPFQCSQGCTTFETRTGSSKIGSIFRIRSRHANPVTLLLYARSSLVGLYMVRDSSNLHVCSFSFS